MYLNIPVDNERQLHKTKQI